MMEMIHLTLGAGMVILRINDCKIKFNRVNKAYTAKEYEDTIRLVYKYMTEKRYTSEPELLSKIIDFLGAKQLIRILDSVFAEEFMEMFRYFVKEYIVNMEIQGRSKGSKLPYSTQAVIMILFNTQSPTVYETIKELSGRSALLSIFEDEVEKYWCPKLESILQEGSSLQYICSKIGIARLSRYCIDHYPEQTRKYFANEARRMTNRQEFATGIPLIKRIFGRKDPDRVFSTRIGEYLKTAMDEETEYQKKVFIENNLKEMAVLKDNWRIFFYEGFNLTYKNYDFRKIRSTSIRLEVKYYLKYRLQGLKNPEDVILDTIYFALNYLTDSNPNIKYFADVTDVDVRKLYIFLETEYKSKFKGSLCVNSIKKAIHNCGCVVDYLMGDMRDINIKSPRPQENLFSKYRFSNSHKYHKNTPVVPEIVAAKLEKHLAELNEVHQVMYKIFANTGLRLKEVVSLKEDCLEASHYSNLMQLKYTPYKILGTRRKKGIGDINTMLIPDFLAKEIRTQIKKSQSLRDELNTPYIFIVPGSVRATIASGWRFCNAINNLVVKHNIIDDSGELWRFTSKQFRKTIAVTLIENGASTEELAYWLGHLRRHTAVQYYEEVREKRLAEMNTEFFRKKFDLLISKEQLENYTEEQRRLLYMDFRLEQRRVELGYCVKVFADGACSERSRTLGCINCKNLCTGKQYFTYWKVLKDSQQAVVDKLLQLYFENNITGYEEFKEYKQEMFLLMCYSNVIERIAAAIKESSDGQ